MSIDTVVYKDLAEDGMPQVLKCITCERDIEDITKAKAIFGRIITYLCSDCQKTIHYQI